MTNLSQDLLAAPVRAAFLKDCRRIRLEDLVPLKAVKPAAKLSHKYQQIVSSIKMVGLIEPPAVTPVPKQPGRYFLLDGHMRTEALRDMGIEEVDCLIAPDDDTYTYNKRINRLSAVQDHRMIARAMDRGISAERLGAALGLAPFTVTQRFRLLEGIAVEVADRLADKPCPAKVFRVLKQMKPIRQIEAAELMVGQKNYSVAFANAMLAATPPALIAHPKRSTADEKVSADSMARMEREIAELQVRNQMTEETYGPDVLQLTVIKGYITTLLARANIVRWLARHRAEYLREFQNLAEITSLPTSAKEPVGPEG